MELINIQRELARQHLDGWLFFDHHQRDPLAYRVLGFRPERQVTRRWYYFIPAEGEPQGLVHRVEGTMLDALPGDKLKYSTWREQADGVAHLLANARRIAMQYSPKCAIPYVSMVDAGTVELVRSLSVEVTSSADLIQLFEARWTASNLETHLEAGRRVDRIRREAFELIGDSIRQGRRIDEFAVKTYILERFEDSGLYTDHGPIVAVNENASNPHYEPTQSRSFQIRPQDLVLIDLWAKLNQPGSVYYDITWTGFCGKNPPSEMQNVFEVVRTARERAVEHVRDAVSRRAALRGFEVDDVARGVIRHSGYGEFFTHRTGHSIGEDVHGTGVNIDNFETHDERFIIPWSCFSIEPGVYLPSFGIRSEVDVFVGDNDARVTGEVQSELVTV
ncbi:MAG: M24 family metallopeptidase [Bryobacterales bacterium]|nr:M24 family metallopeptidase [Bryobacterales bacterium]